MINMMDLAGLVTASELLNVIFGCGLDLENKEELELQATLLGDEEDSTGIKLAPCSLLLATFRRVGWNNSLLSGEDQLIISEFFEGIGGRALKEVEKDEQEDEDAELRKVPTWAVAKERYEDATKARAAFREQVVAAAGGMPSASWAVWWHEQEQQLQPSSIRNAAWAPGRQRFPQWKQELATAEGRRVACYLPLLATCCLLLAACCFPMESSCQLANWEQLAAAGGENSGGRARRSCGAKAREGACPPPHLGFCLGDVLTRVWIDPFHRDMPYVSAVPKSPAGGGRARMNNAFAGMVVNDFVKR